MDMWSIESILYKGDGLCVLFKSLPHIFELLTKLRLNAIAYPSMYTVQAEPKSDCEPAAASKACVLQQCFCCTSYESIWQPQVDW
jgi:hypothetical protein